MKDQTQSPTGESKTSDELDAPLEIALQVIANLEASCEKYSSRLGAAERRVIALEIENKALRKSTDRA